MFDVEYGYNCSFDFIKYCCDNAIYPKFKDKQIKARRVLEFGKKYYWDDAHKGEIPKDINGLGNSILINIYDNKNSYINWHTDSIKNLKDKYVESYSFAINKEDQDKILAVIEFRKNKEITKIDIKHGTKISWNLEYHYNNKISHRVLKTFYPRINLTKRNLI